MTKKSSKNPTDNRYIRPFFSSFQTVRTGRMTSLEEINFLKDFEKSVRTDYGRPIDIRIPYGYHAQVKKVWEMYDTDALFHYLLSRCVDFGANGFEWELPFAYKPGFFQRILDFLGKETKEVSQMKKEQEVWNAWAALINKGVPNVIPGIDEINKWIFKHLLLNGMVSLGWEWEDIKIGDVQYQLPTQMTVWNPLWIVLRRRSEKFVSEEAFLKLPITKEYISEKIKTEYPSDIIEGLPGVEKLNLMGMQKNARQEAFVLKYNWSPGDNTSLILGRNVQVGQGLYPVPPFLGLIEPVIMRRQLYAADLAVLDGIINYLLVWKIGDATKDKDGNLVHEPRPERKDSSGTVLEKSSLELARDLITADTKGQAMQIFMPYYWDLNIITPKIESLLNSEKYLQPTLEVLMAFGILVTYGKTKGFAEINVANLEEMLDNIRLRHIKRFWEALCSEIVQRNKGKLSVVPNMVFNPLNTQTEEFRRGLLGIARLGKISTDTLLKAYRLDKRTEVSRIADEIATGEKEFFESNVPISFKQAVARGESVEEQASARGPGRPSKEEE